MIAHVTFLQSYLPSIRVTFTFSVKRPPARYGIASPIPYGGGLEEIQYEASPVPALFTPPPHGVGAFPLRGTRQ